MELSLPSFRLPSSTQNQPTSLGLRQWYVKHSFPQAPLPERSRPWCLTKPLTCVSPPPDWLWWCHRCLHILRCRRRMGSNGDSIALMDPLAGNFIWLSSTVTPHCPVFSLPDYVCFLCHFCCWDHCRSGQSLLRVSHCVIVHNYYTHFHLVTESVSVLSVPHVQFRMPKMLVCL